MKIIGFRHVHSRRGGVAMVMMLLVVLGLASLTAALLCLNLSHSREQRGGEQEIHAGYVCQAGLSQSVDQLQRRLSGAVGTHTNPARWGRAQLWVQAAPLP